MLKDRKIKLQALTIGRLQNDNLRLRTENRELTRRLQEQSKLTEAAKTYRKEHLKALSSLEDARDRYNEAVREVAAEKKRVQKEFKECIRGLGREVAELTATDRTSPGRIY